jgi:integrase
MEVFCRQLIQDLGDISLEDLTPDVIRQWLTTQRQHLKSSTVHRKYARLSAILRVAVEEYAWLSENPMKRIRKPSPGHSTVRFLSDEERRTLLAECRRSHNHLLYPFVLLALATGGRKDELRTLRWGEVDTERGLVRFLRTKTHKARTVPLIGEALSVIKPLRQPAHLPSDLVFPGRCEGKPLFFGQAWRKARARAGITNSLTGKPLV